MAKEKPEVQEAVGGLLGGLAQGILSGFKFGPGALGNISAVNVIGFVAVIALVFALKAYPFVALGGIALLICYLIYASERGYRFARDNPVEALLGNTQVYQIIKDQMGARDPAIMIDAKPTTAPASEAEKSSGDSDG